MRNEQEIFDELQSVCASAGYIHVLAYFSWRDNFLTYPESGMRPEDLAKSYKPTRLIRTELTTLIGLMLKSEIDFSLPDPTQFQLLIESSDRLLEELHKLFNQPMMEQFIKAASKGSRENPFKRADVLREPIFYGGESAYSFQYRDFALQRYHKDNGWLEKTKGFTIEQAHAFVKSISQLHNKKTLTNWRGMKRDDPSSWTFLPGLTFTLAEIVDNSGLSNEVATSVLRAFMVPTNHRNETFSSLGEFNGASAFPIISHPDGSLVCLQIYTLYEALYDSPFYWMIADKDYAATAQEHRGKFTEQFATQRLRAVFGEERVHSNVNLLGAKGQRIGEVDVLVIFGDRAIIFQCKSKKLTLEARKGNDLQLQADFKLAVQAAYDQALLCAKAIENDTTRYEGLNDNKPTVPTLKEIYLCTLVSDHYPALAVQGRELLNYEVSQSIQPPLVADVFFLDVLAEFLSSPLRFLSYVNLRVALHEKLTSINEINILGYHLKQNLWFEKDVNMVMVADDYGMDLDVAMMVRREGIQGIATPPGILTRMDKMLAGRIIRSIENSEDSSLIDFGLLLLSVSEDTLSALSNGIEQITDQTKRDGKVHDLTMGFEGNEAGLTVHCSNDQNSSAAARLADHCRRRKYVTRAPQWFGFCARLDDGMPKFGLKLESPWEFDPELEVETESMSKASSATYSGGKFKTKKVGRNDECPCGKGKKYKKCCLK